MLSSIDSNLQRILPLSPGAGQRCLTVLFLGNQLQCAECHVHPFVKQWDQKDFWGLAAFFAHTRAERDFGGKDKKQLGPAMFVEVDRHAGPGKGRLFGTGRTGLCPRAPDCRDDC